jgi:hypothetical protein
VPKTKAKCGEFVWVAEGNFITHFRKIELGCFAVLFLTRRIDLVAVELEEPQKDVILKTRRRDCC